MVKGIMHPMYGGFYSKTPELFWVCEVCGQEFEGSKMYSWTMCREHEIDCEIKHKNITR